MDEKPVRKNLVTSLNEFAKGRRSLRVERLGQFLAAFRDRGAPAGSRKTSPGRDRAGVERGLMLREASEQVPQHLFLLGQRPFAARTAAQGDMEQVILDDVRSFG